MDKGYVYILEMNNGKYYIGSTKNVERRFDEHCRGLTKSTRNNRPLRLLFCKEYDNYQTVLEMELYLKRQKSRKVVEDFMGI